MNAFAVSEKMYIMKPFAASNYMHRCFRELYTCTFLSEKCLSLSLVNEISSKVQLQNSFDYAVALSMYSFPGVIINDPGSNL